MFSQEINEIQSCHQTKHRLGLLIPSISSDYEEPSDVGSLRVVVYRYDRLLMHLPSPDNVPGPEHPKSPNYMPVLECPPSPIYVQYVSKPTYPEFMPPEDDVFPAEEQPLPPAVSPTADLPGYITQSDPEEDPEEDDEDPEEDPAYYLTDRDDDDDEEESLKDDADDEDEDAGKEEEEEHLALADFVSPLAYRTTTRMSIRSQTPIPFLSEAEIPSPPFPVSSSLHTNPTDVGAPLGYRAAMIRLRAKSPSTSHLLPLPPHIVLLRTGATMVMLRAAAPSTYILAPRSGILPSRTPPSGTPPLLPIPLHTSSPPLLLPSTNCRTDVLEVTLPPQKRLCIALGPRFEVRECSSAPTARPTGGFRADYGFVGTLDAEIRHDPDREIDFVTTVRQDTDETYGRLKDAQDDRLLMSDQLNLLCRDRRSHARTARLMESEAEASCSRPQMTGTTRKDTDSSEDITDSDCDTRKILDF
nr:hypothetical protein [Tanacetum cinerariifolium]